MIRVATFIDLASIENQYKRLGLELDLTRLKDELVCKWEPKNDPPREPKIDPPWSYGLA